MPPSVHPSRRSSARKFDGPGKLPLIATLIDSVERGNRARFFAHHFSFCQNKTSKSDRLRVTRLCLYVSLFWKCVYICSNNNRDIAIMQILWKCLRNAFRMYILIRIISLIPGLIIFFFAHATYRARI